MPSLDEATIQMAIHALSVGAAPFMLFVSLIALYVRISASRTVRKEEQFALRAQQVAPNWLSQDADNYAALVDGILKEAEAELRAKSGLFSRFFDYLFTQKTDWEEFRTHLRPWLKNSHGALTPEDFRSAVRAARASTRSLTHLLGGIPVESRARFVGALPGILFLLGVFASCLGIAAAIPELVNRLAETPMDIAPLRDFAQTVSWFFGPAALGLGLFVGLSGLNLLFPVRSKLRTLGEEIGGLLSFVWNNRTGVQAPPAAQPERTPEAEPTTPVLEVMTEVESPTDSLTENTTPVEVVSEVSEPYTPSGEPETKASAGLSTDLLAQLEEAHTAESSQTPDPLPQETGIVQEEEKLESTWNEVPQADRNVDDGEHTESKRASEWQVSSPAEIPHDMPDQMAYGGIPTNEGTHESAEALQEFPEAEVEGPMRPPEVAFGGIPLGESFAKEVQTANDSEESKSVSQNEAEEASNAMATLLEQMEQQHVEEKEENTVTHSGVLGGEAPISNEDTDTDVEQTNTEIPPPNITAESMQEILDQIEARRAQRPANPTEAAETEDEWNETDSENVLWGTAATETPQEEEPKSETSTTKSLPEPPAPLWNRPSHTSWEPPAKQNKATTSVPRGDLSPLDQARTRLKEVESQIQQAYEDKIGGKITNALWLQMHTQWAIEKEKLLKEINELEKAA
ncbi:MAG: hypothetical protein KDD51_04945 [Bdellovibrionales bacterium]|nr:hypothetical protein [Bdellovibrionales bacterium]